MHEDTRAALCDFGLSKLHAIVDHRLNPEASTRGHVLPMSTGFTATSFGGTLRYLAPEQLLSDDVGPTVQTDVYAFGCTCAEVGSFTT